VEGDEEVKREEKLVEEKLNEGKDIEDVEPENTDNVEVDEVWQINKQQNIKILLYDELLFKSYY
tara:strand:- start:526 stop:717 length:192 start_codon:yes stop_codon:yes gene_type:complete